MFKKDDFINKIIRDSESSINMYKQQTIEATNQAIKYKKVIDKIKEYIKSDYDRNEEIIDYFNLDYFYKHILELLEEVE